MIYTRKKIAVEVEVPDGATHYELACNQIRFLKAKNNRWFSPGETRWIQTEMSDMYTNYLNQIEVIE